MHGYVRPPLPDLVFRDEDGAVIPYGSRWPDGHGPNETYSVTAHPERFAPYVSVARALVDHLLKTYDVRLEEAVVDGRTRVRLEPQERAGAPLTFTFDKSPMVDVTAGARTSIAWFCSCDHCDEDVQVAIENLEEQVATVVAGGLREWLNDGERVDDPFGDLFLAYALQDPDGTDWQSGSSSVDEAERERLRIEFARVPERWAPWPLRPGAAPSP